MLAPRVLLVEDDAAVRRLVQMALEDMELDLLACADVQQALAALAGAPVALVITDLMMPGVSGVDLLRRLQAEPGLCRGGRRVAFSAGLDAAMRQRLQELDVWRLLDKPVAVQALRHCVAEALAAGAEPAWSPAGTHPEPGVDEAGLIERQFAGDAALFRAFRASAHEQFRADADAGDHACKADDTAALRRLGHSLKSVLESLGHAEAMQQARALELAALAGDRDARHICWNGLAKTLRALAGPQK